MLIAMTLNKGKWTVRSFLIISARAIKWHKNGDKLAEKSGCNEKASMLY